MIEIILRNDIASYTPKPILGMTYRQIATIAACAVACVGSAAICILLGMTGLVGPVAMTIGVCVGFVGLGKVDDMHVEQWFRIWKSNAEWPEVAVRSPIDLVMAKPEDATEPKKTKKKRLVECELS